MKRQKFLLFLVLLLFISVSFILCKKEIPEGAKSTDIVLISKVNNTMDAVKIPHIKHQEAEVKCVVCHHKNENDDRIKNCSKCHKGKGADETMHNLCVNCHKERNKGPKDCTDCHKEKI